MKFSNKLRFAMAALLTSSVVSFSANADDFTIRDLHKEAILALSWVQTAAEFKALAYQAFNIAKLRWDMDEKGGKRAVVVDLGQTVIDMSPFGAGLIGKDYGVSDEVWKEWCDSESATAIPGSVEFLNHVVNTGGDVFYLSNRKAQPEKNMDLTEVTMNNLKSLGFPQVNNDHLLLRTGTSKKQPRRELILGKGYRIVLLLGDNLNDFSSEFGGQTVAERAEAVEANKDKFGDTFIVLPNPIYGSWEAAVYGGGKWYLKSAKERSEIRTETLKKFKFSKF